MPLRAKINHCFGSDADIDKRAIPPILNIGPVSGDFGSRQRAKAAVMALRDRDIKHQFPVPGVMHHVR